MLLALSWRLNKVLLFLLLLSDLSISEGTGTLLRKTLVIH